MGEICLIGFGQHGENPETDPLVHGLVESDCRMGRAHRTSSNLIPTAIVAITAA